MSIQEGKVLSGSSGKIFFDGDELYYVTKTEMKITPKRETFDLVGELDEFSKLVGLTGKGSVTILRTDSYVHKKFVTAIQKGEDPEFTFVGEVNDKQSGEQFTVTAPGAKIDGDIDILSFEPKKLMEQTISFVFPPTLVELE